jgi:hypothetical protein
MKKHCSCTTARKATSKLLHTALAAFTAHAQQLLTNTGFYFAILTSRGVVIALAKAGANPNIGRINGKTLLMHYSEKGDA